MKIINKLSSTKRLGLALTKAVNLTIILISVSTQTVYAQDIEVGGIVVAVSDDGAINLNSGSTVRQWGIKVTDPHALEELITGKWIDCLVLVEPTYGVIVDTGGKNLGHCRVSSNLEHTRHFQSYMYLFAWMPSLNIGEMACDEASFIEPLRLNHRGAGTSTYSCNSGLPYIRAAIVEID